MVYRVLMRRLSQFTCFRFKCLEFGRGANDRIAWQQTMTQAVIRYNVLSEVDTSYKNILFSCNERAPLIHGLKSFILLA